uniref:ATP-dependent RNA helicase DDX54 n=1 Tax=Lygus hesperus TaxID=30085 RepID=A0A0A9X631_LYGHE
MTRPAVKSKWRIMKKRPKLLKYNVIYPSSLRILATREQRVSQSSQNGGSCSRVQMADHEETKDTEQKSFRKRWNVKSKWKFRLDKNDFNFLHKFLATFDSAEAKFRTSFSFFHSFN